MTNQTATRGQIEWVSINSVVPNPLNPRKNDSVRTEEMQNILKNRGWEEPLTVYQKGKVYVVLAGHRRLYAAKEVGIKEIPVFVTDQPEDHSEELERIASLQSGRVEWTGWEWARFTYERWIAWNKPPVTKFAKDINLRHAAVKTYIHVMEFFPRNEIESALTKGEFTIHGLHAVRAWLIRLEKSHPKLVEELGEDLIRKYMIEKLESRRLGTQALKNTHFLDHVSSEMLREFLFDKDMSLEKLIEKYGDSDGTAYKSFQGYLISIGRFTSRISDMRPKTPHQRETALDQLKELQSKINTQIKSLEKTKD